MQSYIFKTISGYLSLDQLSTAINFPIAKLLPEVNYYTLAVEKESIGIAQVKHAISWMKTLKADGLGKLLVITTADLLTIEAQNALLKLLEEPGERNSIVLISAYPDTLLPTILSRCLLVNDHASPTDLPPLTPEREQLFSDLLTQPPITAIVMLDTLGISKDNQHARQFLLDFITYLQNTLVHRSKIIRQILRTLDMLDHNVNTRLAIETFLLDLPSTH